MVFSDGISRMLISSIAHTSWLSPLWLICRHSIKQLLFSRFSLKIVRLIVLITKSNHSSAWELSAKEPNYPKSGARTSPIRKRSTIVQCTPLEHDNSRIIDFRSRLRSVGLVPKHCGLAPPSRKVNSTILRRKESKCSGYRRRSEIVLRRTAIDIR